MTDALIASAPDFDQPIAVLKHCHDRIRKQLATLQKLLDHLPGHGADQDARAAAAAVLKYFELAAPHHHADEEQDLLPMLIACAHEQDALLLRQLAPRILEQHSRMDALWQDLHEQLRAIADGSSNVLAAPAVEAFCTCYVSHMEIEETHIAPMAKRLFSPLQMAQLGRAMQLRRGLLDDAATSATTSAATSAARSATTAATSAALPLADLRREYGQASLSEAEVAHDPFVQFANWFEQALAAQVSEPNAMSVATVDQHGRPSSRIVLIKQYDARGFTWYTNYDSQKGRELQANPHAALLFFWNELERQVRIEGKVERTSATESDKYFHSRPLKSRLAAVASHQSEPIADRQTLEQHYDAAAAEWGEAPARPEHWGGFRLVPDRIEFWQGRRSRFHDRIVYSLQPDGNWTRQRLQP